jgi:hypothetical protein
MGKIDKGVTCSVSGCGATAERSISRTQLAGSDLSAGGSDRRIYLCREHYKAWKKGTKRNRDVERARWG